MLLKDVADGALKSGGDASEAERVEITERENLTLQTRKRFDFLTESTFQPIIFHDFTLIFRHFSTYFDQILLDFRPQHRCS